ncbi:MAG: hypothetical protein CMC13_03695 [Flavobacteriaceae bacterium]|nr:hypothetical protein [Flavobacteriaceae bacterium]
MKKLFILLVLFCTTSGVFAQEPQLFDIDWYVTSIDLDGNNYPTPPISPINSGIAHVTFVENTKEFFAFFCDSLGGRPMLQPTLHSNYLEVLFS